ncbi:MAG TPA: hypothetical protein VGG39_24485 [Polyangiaceae bacterium]
MKHAFLVACAFAGSAWSSSGLASPTSADPARAVAAAAARAKRGDLVEARDLLTPIVFDPAPPAGESSAAAAGRATAKQMLLELGRRIPRVKLDVAEPHGALHVVLDGGALPPGAERLPVPVDPGHHRIIVDDGSLVARAELDIAEGATQIVSLHLGSPPPPPTPALAPAPTPAPAPSYPPPLPPPPATPRDDVDAASRAKFSVGRFFLESLGAAVVGSLAAYGTFKATCGNDPCLGGSLGALGVNMAVTPVTVWGIGQAAGGDGGLGWAFVGGLVAFSGYTAGTTDPTLPLAIGVVLMPFTSALLYEVSSGANAQRAHDPRPRVRPSIAPVPGRGSGLAGAMGSIAGSF